MEIVLVWALLGVGALGFMLALRFRAPALLAAALVIAAVNVTVAVVEHWSVGFSVISTIILLITLQAGYLAGLLVTSSRLDASDGGR